MLRSGAAGYDCVTFALTDGFFLILKHHATAPGSVDKSRVSAQAEVVISVMHDGCKRLPERRAACDNAGGLLAWPTIAQWATGQQAARSLFTLRNTHLGPRWLFL
jgi:hypothetical protein